MLWRHISLHKEEQINLEKRNLYIIIIIIIIIGIEPLGRFEQRPEVSQATGMASVTLHPGQVLRGSLPLFSPRLDVPTFATRCLHVRHNASDPSGGILGETKVTSH